MKTPVIALAAAMACAGTLCAKKLYVTLGEALEKKFVRGHGAGNGGHSGRCVTLHLTNLLPDSLMVIVEPGRRLRASEGKQQDILIVKTEKIQMRGRRRAP